MKKVLLPLLILFLCCFLTHAKEFAGYNEAKYPMYVDGNIYCNQAIPFGKEQHNFSDQGFNPQLKIEEKGKEVYVSFSMQGLNRIQTGLVDTQRYTDYLGNKRSGNPTPGPFEQVKEGALYFKI